MKKRKSHRAPRAHPAPQPAPAAVDRAAAVFGDAFTAANDALARHGGGPSASVVAEVAEGARAWLTGKVAALGAEWGLSPVACREGCGWCCSVPARFPVSAWPLELFALAAWLRAHRTPDEIEALRGRLREAARRGAREGNARERVPCPLLDGARCGAYPARPASCVGWNAADASACEAYAKGDDSSKCRVDPVRLFAARAVPLATAAALMRHGGPGFDQEGAGPGGFVDLSTGLLAVLERGPAALEDWLAGGPVLSAATHVARGLRGAQSRALEGMARAPVE
ncbi:MAG TPA: YkgJ family cysteine cluster protein [Anaeromyxobacteraceae bacterium]|nr:YkgJ family cysteine cluster protein [Anaeromyxobacteraceae bacterium]